MEKYEDHNVRISKEEYVRLRNKLMAYPHEYSVKWTEAGRNVVVAAIHIPAGYADHLHPDEPVSVYIKKEDL